MVPWRLRQLRAAFDGFEASARGEERADLDSWCGKQAHWLEDYALFMALDGANEMRPWWLWAPELRAREPAAMCQ